MAVEERVQRIAKEYCLGEFTTERYEQFVSCLTAELRAMRAETMRELDFKYNAYCEKKVSEAWNGAIGTAAEVAEYHSGPSIQLAEHIRALKRPHHNDGPEHCCDECRPSLEV